MENELLPSLCLTELGYFLWGSLSYKELRNIFNAWANKTGWEATIRKKIGTLKLLSIEFQHTVLRTLRISSLFFFLFLPLFIFWKHPGFFHVPHLPYITLPFYPKVDDCPNTPCLTLTLLPWLNINAEKAYYSNICYMG